MLDRIMSFNWLLSCPFEEFADESKRIGLFLVFCAKDKLQMHKSDKIIDNIFNDNPQYPQMYYLCN